MKIGVRLSIGFAIIIIGLIVVIIYSSNALKEIDDMSSQTAKVYFPKTIWANNIIRAVNEAARVIRNAMLIDKNNTTEIQKELTRLNGLGSVVKSNMDSLTINSNTEKDKEYLEKILNTRNEYVVNRDIIVSNINNGNFEEAQKVLFTTMRTAQSNYEQASLALIEYENQLVNESAIKTNELYKSISNFLIILSIIICVLSIAIAYWIIVSITKPINRAVLAADKIAIGDLKVDLETDAKDETGKLLNSMKAMANNIKRLIDDTNKLSRTAIEGKLDNRADASNHQGEYQNIINGINKTLDAVIGPLNVAAEYVDRISKGDIPPRITDSYSGDFNEIKNNLNTCIDAINALAIDTGTLAKAATEGKLDTRANTAKHGGEFKTIVEGINTTLDAVIGPLNVAAEYVDRISKGDIPPKITDNYSGDFNEIKNNLNTCIDTLSAMLKEMAQVTSNMQNGQLSERANANAYTGDWSKLMAGVNKIVEALVEPLNFTNDNITRIAKGDIPQLITKDYKGDYNLIKNSFNTCIKAINLLVADASMLAKAAAEGKLDTRADVGKHGGDFASIIEGVNRTLDNVIGPLNVAAEYVDRISKGDIPPKITDNYHGDFNEIKNNLNTCIDSLSIMLADISRISSNMQRGKLDDRGNVAAFTGDWGKLMAGINKIIDSLVTPINFTSKTIERISKGDIPEIITEEYRGDFNLIKDSVNTCIKAINLLVYDAKTLAKSAAEGKLDNRADVSKHGGEFAAIIEGVNRTLDSVIGPLNVAAEYVDRISKGDIPPKITDEYHGDFNEIKNNLNGCIDNISTILKGIARVSNSMVNGDLTDRTNSSLFTGDWAKLVEGINDIINALIMPIDLMADNLNRIAKGDIPQTITENYKGDFNNFKISINTCIEAIGALVTDTKMLANSAIEGKLKIRADENKHNGEYAEIIQGINKTLDNIVEPVNEAGEVLSVLASGNLTARMKGDYQGELQNLKNDINSLAESLSNVISQILDAVQQSASAALQISSTAETMAASAQEQSSQADEVATAVEEMSRTITENAMSANKTANVADKNGAVAKDGGKVVEQTVTKMRDIANVVKLSADNIEKLGESSKQIGEIISVIDDIADQTNLLALNAAIEAARAGEQGRGFAVVADEVRKLAERTTEATKQIAGMIKGIQNETQEAVVAMKKGNDEVNSGISLADQAGSALQQIVISSQDVLDMINQIAAATEEQSTTSEEIAKNVGGISSVSNESAKRIQDIAHSSDDLAKLTEHLKDLVNQFKVDYSDISSKNNRLTTNSISRFGRNERKHLPPGDYNS